MNSTFNSILQICGTTFILFLILLYPIYYFGGGIWIKGVSLGYLLSLLIVLFSYLSIQRAFQLSLKTFYAIVLGGMTLRFVIFLAAVYAVWHFALVNIVAFIISFMVFYLFLQIFEIRFINRELLKNRSKK